MGTLKIVNLTDIGVESCLTKYPLIEKFDINESKVFVFNGTIIGYVTNISNPKDIIMKVDFGDNAERILRLLLENTSKEQDLNIPEVRRCITTEYICRNLEEYQKDILRRILIDADGKVCQMNMLRRR